MTYRSRGPSLASGVIAVLFAGWMAGDIVIVVQAGKAVAGVPLIVAVALPVLWMLIRSMKAAVTTDVEGVVVRNLFRTVWLDWSQINRFVVGTAGFRSRVALVELADGTVIAAWGIQGPNSATRPNSLVAERLVDRLQADLEAQRAAQARGRCQPASCALGESRQGPAIGR
ncbi:MAG: Bacterial domain [Solirubrobacteraceae bacterium]|nr:Bacterial domain [Solirubrobacteraceae bacterium]